MIDLYVVLRPLFQPAIGGFHGWLATYMVVKMLFRPHKAYYFPFTNKKIPFTPGIFPSRKSDLARNIGRTVTESLLTPEDIKLKIETFLTEDRLYSVVSTTFDTIIDDFRYTDNIQKIANFFSSSIPDFLNSSISILMKKLNDKNNNIIPKISEYIVNEFILNIKISDKMASKIIDYTMNNIISPSNIRNSLHDALSPERASNIQTLIRSKTTGALKFILSLINIEAIFNNLKQYLNNEPEKSEILIKDIIEQLKIRDDLIKRLKELDLKKLSFETILSLKENINNGIENYILNHSDKITNSLKGLNENLSEIIHYQIVNFNPADIKEETLNNIKKAVTSFLYNYLKSDLAEIVNKGISALRPKEMIEGKIEAYSSQDVENLILSIMKKELKNLEVLGLIIGLGLGIIAMFVEILLPYK